MIETAKATITKPSPQLFTGELAEGTEDLLATIIKSRAATPRELTLLIPPKVRGNRARFRQVVTDIGSFIREHRITIVSDGQLAKFSRTAVMAEQKVAPPLRKINRPKQPEVRQKHPEPEGTEPSFTSEEVDYDALTMYMAEATKYKLLSKEEEYELGRRIQEEGDLDARNTLVEHNLRLVRWIVNRKFGWCDWPLEDLIQEGNIGLMVAANKYNPGLGVRFASYAFNWVFSKIDRAIMNDTLPVRIPVNMGNLQRVVTRAMREIERETGARPEAEAVARRLHISQKTVARAVHTLTSSVSLDEELEIESKGSKSKTGATVGELLPDTVSMSPEVYAMAYEEFDALHERIKKVILLIERDTHISSRDYEVFRYYYGLDDDGHVRTLDTTGKHFNLTRECIRQIVVHIWNRSKIHTEDVNHDQFLEMLAQFEELGKLVLSGKGTR